MRRRLAEQLLCCLFILPCLMGGCGDQVQEDRTITFSGDGTVAGFQHGGSGLFVANPQAGVL